MAMKKRTKRATKKTATKRTVKKRGRKVTKGATRKTVKKPGRKPGRKKAGKKAGKKTVKKTVKKVGKRGRKPAKKKSSKRGRKKAAKPSAESVEEVVAEPEPVTVKTIETRKLVPKPAMSATTTSLSGARQKIKDFLMHKKVNFEVLKHSPAFTAQQIAASAHISGKNLAKTVIVKIDGKMAMVVEPAHMKVNLDILRKLLNAQRVELASEAEFRTRFPECELGAMPPLGGLYGMDVYVSDHLTHDEEISFNAGTHSELIKMSYKDFLQLVQPKVVSA